MTKRHVYDPNAATMTQAQVDAFYATKRADKEARRARKAELAAGRTLSPEKPAAILAALAVGASHTFANYRSTAQVSASLRASYIRTGQRYTSALARDLLTGETVTGVTVTRTT